MTCRNQSGITLIEVLITISITAIVSVFLVGIFTQNNNLFYNQSAKVSHGVSSNEVINLIDDSIRGATAVEAQYPAQNPSHVTGANTLILKIPSVDASGNIISDTYDYLVFTTDASLPAILRQITYPSAQSSRPATNTVITQSLKTLKFSYLNDTKAAVSPLLASLVSYDLNLSSAQGNSIVESSASGQTRLRNN